MNRARIGLGSCGVAAGGRELAKALRAAAKSMNLQLELVATGCAGLCWREPMVQLEGSELGPCLYGDVTPDVAGALLRAHYLLKRPPAALLLARAGQQVAENAFVAHQQRRILGRCGQIDPESLADYQATGGYVGLADTLRAHTPQELIALVGAAGLRGRGGAGYETARKWLACRQGPPQQRYVVCNADEGDPGAFMDRNLLEADPHSVIEGMILAAYAVGADRGYVYVRDEYPLAARRVGKAVEDARQAGFLGDGICGTDLCLDIEVRRGAGAFVCGEETALIAALQGQRGSPVRRPPYPVHAGLWDRPTSINNVETYANVTWIASHGADAYRALGSPGNWGTKIFSLAGDVRRTGMVEVGLGATVRQVVEHVGGGALRGRTLKAVQIGGPSGGCLPTALFDTPIDYESLRAAGAMMGSGGIVVLDDRACMVDVARYFLGFLSDESCGKCSACRIGTKRMAEILERICGGLGKPGDLEQLESLAVLVGDVSACGLGRSAPNPVLSTLRWFRAEYQAHIDLGRCPAGQCKKISRFAIEPYVCDGCRKCERQCPYNAIVPLGTGIPMSIVADACHRCGGCREVCDFGAVHSV